MRKPYKEREKIYNKITKFIEGEEMTPLDLAVYISDRLELALLKSCGEAKYERVSDAIDTAEEQVNMYSLHKTSDLASNEGVPYVNILPSLYAKLSVTAIEVLEMILSDNKLNKMSDEVITILENAQRSLDLDLLKSVEDKIPAVIYKDIYEFIVDNK